MLAFKSALIPHAKKAGIKIPEDIDYYNSNEYPHWYVFTVYQISRPLPRWDIVWNNAEIIGKIPEDKIREVSINDLVEMGCQ